MVKVRFRERLEVKFRLRVRGKGGERSMRSEWRPIANLTLILTLAIALTLSLAYPIFYLSSNP